MSKTTLLKDYSPPAYLIPEVHLEFALHGRSTQVEATLHFERNVGVSEGSALVLDGDGIVLDRVYLNGKMIDSSQYRASPDHFELLKPPSENFTLTFHTLVDPEGNTELSGLYRSSGVYTTQCEAEGFRRITYFADRPDVLSVYTVKIYVKESEASVVFSNGNLIEEGVEKKRKFAIWHDPFPKPCYLFALVAGHLEGVFETFTTAQKRKVRLGVYTVAGKSERARFALEALTHAMRFDEKAYGRCYDLDVFNIVAVPDFNMGAMENKGLNIFNDKYILADPQTATDSDYTLIDAVVAHEYFHNWTGNRITCRDWFQLCLKEGLTVYREQTYMASRRSEAVSRIGDVRRLKTHQFAEDAGPLAHPVRPDTYGAIDNLYTATVYEKGAEVIRVLKEWVGDKPFKASLNLFFQRHDGQAVTVEDFLQCFAEKADLDVPFFMRWYTQAGTPTLQVKTKHLVTKNVLTLNVTQDLPKKANLPDPEPLPLPLKIAMVPRDGKAKPRELILNLVDFHQPFVLVDTEDCALSLNCGFGAPVIIDNLTEKEGDLALLAKSTPDPFNRWQSLQQLYLSYLKTSYFGENSLEGKDLHAIFQAVDAALKDGALPPALAAEFLTLPSEAEISREIQEAINPDLVYATRLKLKLSIAQNFVERFSQLWKKYAQFEGFELTPEAAGERALANLCLDYLVCADGDTFGYLTLEAYEKSQNLTNRFAALSVAMRANVAQAKPLLKVFENQYQNEALVLDKWFALQAMQPTHQTLDHVKKLMKHSKFSMQNPNRMRSLIGSFAHSNLVGFHAPDGAGYQFVLEQVGFVDKMNPQVAARLLTSFNSWKSVDAARKGLALKALTQFQAQNDFSKDVQDVLARMLKT